MNKINNNGFTLVSLVVTAAIIVVLVGIIYVWVDPVARVGDAKNQKRRNDVLTIANSFHDYMIDNKGALPFLGGINTSTKKVLCSSNTSLTCDSDTDGCLVIDDVNFSNDYLAELPVDPDKTSEADTGYFLQKSSTTDQLIVGACDTYDSLEITYSPLISINCNGYAAGYCWYMATNTTHDCDTVCSNLDMTCIDDVNYGSDTACELSQEFSNGCDTACSAASGSAPPAHHETTDACLYQTGAVDCSANTASYYSICPCQ